MTTPILRNIGDIPVSLLEANTIDWNWFVRVDVAAPVGTKRFTDRGANFTGAIEASGAATWLCGSALEVGEIEQGRQFVLNPTQFSIANLDNTWGNWASSPGLRDAPAEIYVGWYTAAGALAGAVKLYHGRIDNHRILGRAELALKPWLATWGRRAMTRVPGLSPDLQAPLRPKDGEKIHWGPYE